MLTLIAVIMENNRLMMSNSCKQTSTLSNTAEIVENKRPIKLSLLQWSSLNPPFIFIPHSAGVLKISKV